MKKELKMRVRTKHNPIQKAGTYLMKVVDAGFCLMPKKPFGDPTPMFKIFLEEVGGDYTLTDDHALAGYYKFMADIKLPERLLVTKVRDLKLTKDEKECFDKRSYKPGEFVKMSEADRKAVLYSRLQSEDESVTYVVDHNGNRVVNESNAETAAIAFYSKMARIYKVDLEQLVEGESIDLDCKLIAQQIVGKEFVLVIDQNRNGKWEVKTEGKASQLA